MTPRANALPLFIAAPPGLEHITHQELLKLFAARQDAAVRDSIVAETGGFSLTGRLDHLYRCNLHLRTATHVLLRLGSFRAAGFPQLQRHAAKLPWERYLANDRPVSIRVTCKKSRLYHSDAVAQRIRAVIKKRIGPLPLAPAGAPPAEMQHVAIRLLRDDCTVSIDSSGEPLHRRGYRRDAGGAPIRENLAAGMVLAAGWDAAFPLIDPFCGSGTIAIEAAMIGGGIPPGQQRTFAFQRWPDFNEARWEKMQAGDGTQSDHGSLQIHASDRNEGAIRAAAANAGRAGIEEHIQFATRTFSSLQPAGPRGWIITNPPYGRRLDDDRDIRNLYAKLGNILRERFKGWQLAMVCSSDSLLHQLGIPWESIALLDNGGIRVRLIRAEIR